MDQVVVLYDESLPHVGPNGVISSNARRNLHAGASLPSALHVQLSLPCSAWRHVWVPELRSIATECQHEPPPSGERLPPDYPAPLVDHALVEASELFAKTGEHTRFVSRVLAGPGFAPPDRP